MISLNVLQANVNYNCLFLKYTIHTKKTVVKISPHTKQHVQSIIWRYVLKHKFAR